jgi:hypothetical protein
VDPHHFNADPDPEPDPDFYLMRMPIRITLIYTVLFHVVSDIVLSQAWDW